MKLALEWTIETCGNDSTALVLRPNQIMALVESVQADALRYAANLSGDSKDMFLLALADQLDPQPPHPKP